jgi:hypothetical protein
MDWLGRDSLSAYTSEIPHTQNILYKSHKPETGSRKGLQQYHILDATIIFLPISCVI